MFRGKKLLAELYLSYLLIIIISITSIGLYSSKSLRDNYYGRISTDLEATANLVKEQLLNNTTDWNIQTIDSICKNIGNTMSNRITVVDSEGKVLGDTSKDPKFMENHSDRPEIQAAIKNKQGQSTRYSYTLKKDLMYVARPILKNNKVIGVVRASMSVAAIELSVDKMKNRLLVFGVIISLIAAVIGFLISNRLRLPLKEIIEGSERFAKGELDYRLPSRSSEEMGKLTDALNNMAQDLSERIKSVTDQKNELEAILSSMVEGVLVINKDQKILRCNRAAGAFFGINSFAVKGLSLQEATRNPHLHEFVKTILGSDSSVESEIQTHDPKEKFFQATGTKLKDINDNLMGALIVLNDITKIKKLENIRKDFVSNVSHELKTPITSIKGFVETLKDGASKNTKDRERFLGIISAHSERLNSIIEDLLSLSRIEQMEDKEKIPREEVKIKNTLSSAISMCQISSREKNISIEFDCENDLTANINPPFIENAVTNLLDNAIKYSQENSRVKLTALKKADQIIIAVEDEGCGISNEHLDRIFERFYRVDKARSRKLGGTGLGLAIVKHIVRAHGGEIKVKSESGIGSTFSIYLPA